MTFPATNARYCEAWSRQDVQVGPFGTTIEHSDLNQDVFASIVCVLHECIEVVIAIKNTGIEQFVLGVGPTVFLVGSSPPLSQAIYWAWS